MAILLVALVILIVPISAGAADQQVAKYVDNAVDAVRTTCYEARMTYLSPFDEGLEQQVHIFHVAPELFRVVPLVRGVEGETVFIENAVELARIRNGYAEIMPKRQFFTNDNLTIKFLRDLGRHEGTTLLDGKAAGRAVYVLRQDLSQTKPYTITVGLDQANYYPVFLLVLDAEGKRRVYYEMDVIEYCTPTEIADSLFMMESSYKQLPAPRNKSLSAVQEKEEPEEIWLPLIPDPDSLPEGYFLESINTLNFKSGTSDSIEFSVVYQLAIFGPQSDLLSVFQTRATDFDLGTESLIKSKDSDYLVTRVDGWTVAAFGSLSIDQFKEIIDSLHIDKIKAEQLIIESQAKQTLLYGE